MLHILLLILKIIGILLAVILGILVLLILIVLFAPVCWRAEGMAEGGRKDLRLRGRVSWLFGLIGFNLKWENGSLGYSLRIAWKRLGEKAQSEKSEKAQPDKAKERRPDKTEEAQQTVDGPYGTSEEVWDDRTNQKAEQGPEEAEQTNKKRKKASAGDPKSRKNREKAFAEKIKCTFRGFCDKIKALREKKEKAAGFLTDETHIRAFRKGKDELFRLLRKLAPERLSGKLTFGFSDPSLTGRALAALAMLYPFIGKHTEITPDFEHAVLDGKLKARGRIFLIYPAAAAIRLLLSRDVRRTVRDVKNFKL